MHPFLACLALSLSGLCLGVVSTSGFGFYLFSWVFHNSSVTPPPPLPTCRPRALSRLLPICMSTHSILVSAIRSAVASLRAIASSLEAALDGAKAVSSAFAGPEAPVTAASLDLDLEASAISASFAGASSGPSASRVSSHDEIAQLLTAAPPACHQICATLQCPPEEKRSRTQRAWEAGLWAKATLTGQIDRPRPTPKLDKRPTVYVILRAPGISRPTRVSTSSEYFQLIPRFTPDSVSHSFPSLAEGKVYCLAAEVDFPEQRSQ